ncbi:MAG: GNAT family N-acetyltransferase [Candidatus Woesearchaeota archaeon]
MPLCEQVDMYMFSECSSDKRESVLAYLLDEIKTPDKGSIFEHQTRHLRYILSFPIVASLVLKPSITCLRLRGYDALLCSKFDTIFAYSAFQVHKDKSLHIFSMFVDSNYRGNGYGHKMAQNIIQFSRENDIKRVRIGGGNNSVTNRIHEKLKEKEDELSIEVRDKNWVYLLS